MIKPMLCEKQAKVNGSDKFIWEVKYDGIRIIATTSDGKGTTLQARSGTDKTRLFPELDILTKKPAILDGEIVCYDENGKSQFNGIQHRANRANGIEWAMKTYPAHLVVFDVLQVGDADLQPVPLHTRKEILDALLIPTDTVKVAPYFKDGTSLYEHIKAEHMEGVVGKLLNGRYSQGKRDWVKVKVPQLGVFVICGYTQGTGWRASTFGALVLGLPTERGLLYVGSVGTGFNDAEIERICQKVFSQPVIDCPFGREPEKAIWVKPEIFCMVEYLELTKDNRLRFPSYKGIVD